MNQATSLQDAGVVGIASGLHDVDHVTVHDVLNPHSVRVALDAGAATTGLSDHTHEVQQLKKVQAVADFQFTEEVDDLGSEPEPETRGLVRQGLHFEFFEQLLVSQKFALFDLFHTALVALPKTRVCQQTEFMGHGFKLINDSLDVLLGQADNTWGYYCHNSSAQVSAGARVNRIYALKPYLSSTTLDNVHYIAIGCSAKSCSARCTKTSRAAQKVLA